MLKKTLFCISFHTVTFLILDFDNGGCEADNHVPAGNIAGDTLTFSGCDVVTSYNPEVGLTKDDYTTMTYWQRVK